MKNFVDASLFTSRAKRATLHFAVCALLLTALQHRAFGQWQQATGFSNENAFNAASVDGVNGIIPWGDSLLGSANCVTSSADPGATFDSLSLSTDHGQTWTDFAPNGGFPLVAISTGSSGSALIGGAEPNPTATIPTDVLSYSTDQGQTWEIDTAGWNIPGGSGQASSLATIGGTIFASNLSGVYQQTSPGATWTLDVNGIDNVFEFGLLAASGNNLFLSTSLNGGGGEIYVSTNQGSSWESENNGLATYSSYGSSNYFQAYLFAVSGSSVYAAFAHDTDMFGGGDDFDTLDFYLTTDNGQNWNKINSSLQNWGNVRGFVASGQNLFIGADSGFYYSTNSGSTWTLGDEGLQLIRGDYPSAVQISGGNVVIGTQYDGAWYRSLSDFGVSSVAASATPSAGLNLALSENPASSSQVKVTYTMSDGGSAQVLLMDALGRTVRMLQNGPSIPGENTLIIDPLTLAPGTYFVRLTAQGASAMQKLEITR